MVSPFWCVSYIRSGAEGPVGGRRGWVVRGVVVAPILSRILATHVPHAATPDTREGERDPTREKDASRQSSPQAKKSRHQRYALFGLLTF